MQRETLERTYRQWAPLIYRRCLRLLRHEEEARDAMQEVFLRLSRHLDDYRDEDVTMNLCYTVATRLCLNRLRDAKRTVDASILDRLPQGPGLEQGRTEARQLVDAVFAHEDEAAMAGFLTYVDGLTQDETAALLGVSRRTVVRLLQRFRERAREL